MKTINIKRRKAYHHGDLRAALVDTALQLLERGEDGQLSLSAVARRVGVSPQAAYNHFSDKGQLLASAAARSLQDFTAAMKKAAHGPPLEALQRVGVAYVVYATEHPSQFKLWRSPELADRRRWPELQAAYASTFAVLVERLEACRAAGLIPPRQDLLALAASAWSLVHGLASLCVDGQLADSGIRGPPRRLAESAVRRLFLGLGDELLESRR